MTRERCNATAIVLLIALLAGCGTSPKSTFYTISSATPQQPQEANASKAAPYSVSIGPITVPDTVDRPEIITRSGANRLLIHEYHRWAEPLRSEIPKIIAQDLMGLLGTYRVSSYPQRADEDADYHVTLDIQRFESTLGGNATIEALWSVSKRSSPPPVKGYTVATEATGADTYDALVAAHRRALAAVSRDIAAAIRSIGTTQAGK